MISKYYEEITFNDSVNSHSKGLSPYFDNAIISYFKVNMTLRLATLSYG